VINLSLYSVLESVLVVAAFIITLIGNIFLNLLFILIGSMLGVLAFFGALFITIKVKKQAGIEDIIFINALVYPLMVVIVLTLGVIDLGLSQFQVLWFDLALIISVFLIFICSWIFLRKKWKFLTIENIDFTNKMDREKYPQFLLATLVISILLGGYFVLFKFLYMLLGYQITSYILMAFTLCTTIILSFFLSLIKRKIKTRTPKKVKSQPTKTRP